MTSITSAGHSNIYSVAADTTSTTAIVVSASRTYNGRQYFFSNLTFNMPTNANTDITDWTAPANSSTWKWSYVYIRPSDNKFYLSNTAPAAGLNYRSIGGSVCLYLFPAYTSSIYLYSFQLSNNNYSIEQKSALVLYQWYEYGITLTSDWSSALTRTTSTVDATAAMPTTATELLTGFRHSVNGRYDTGGLVGYEAAAQIQNSSGTWVDVHRINSYHYLKTPTSTGAYYPPLRFAPVFINISRKNFNFAAIRLYWNYDQGQVDAYTGAGWWLNGFTDGSIF
jgi:hypothetical protein